MLCDIPMNVPSDPLAGRLREWHVAPSVDPNFRHAVWTRIAATGVEPSWPAYLRAHATAWGIAAALAVAAAGYTGHAVARAHVRADREAMVVTYLTDLDPRVQAGVKSGVP
jgi:hypothetical protein